MSEITERYAPQIEALRAMSEELRTLEVPDLEAYEPEPADPAADEAAGSWLFDSQRTYLEQIDAYKQADGNRGQVSNGEEERR